MRARVDIAISSLLGFVTAVGAGILATEVIQRLWANSTIDFFAPTGWGDEAAVLPGALAGLALVLVATLARRWGWLAVAVAVAAWLVVPSPSVLADDWLHNVGLRSIRGLLAGIILGGVAAAFGAAGRWTRVAIGAGLVVGLLGSDAVARQTPDRPVLLATLVVSLLAVVWALVRRPDPVPVAGVTAALGVVIALAGAAAVVAAVHLSIVDRRDGGVTLRWPGSVWALAGVAVVVAALAVPAAHREGRWAGARWTLTLFAVGLADGLTHFTRATGRVEVAAVIVIGVGVGAVLALLTARVPWDAIFIVVLGVAGGFGLARGPSGILSTFGSGLPGERPILVLAVLGAAGAALGAAGTTLAAGGHRAGSLALGLIAFLITEWVGGLVAIGAQLVPLAALGLAVVGIMVFFGLDLRPVRPVLNQSVDKSVEADVA